MTTIFCITENGKCLKVPIQDSLIYSKSRESYFLLLQSGIVLLVENQKDNKINKRASAFVLDPITQIKGNVEFFYSPEPKNQKMTLIPVGCGYPAHYRRLPSPIIELIPLHHFRLLHANQQ